jgi:hypothetical protein
MSANRTPSIGKSGAGTTLIEVLISSALFALVIGGVYLLYTTMQATLSRGELMTDIQQNARVGMNRLVQDLRNTGNDPNNTLPNPEGLNAGQFPNGPLRSAGPDCVAFIAPSRDVNNQPISVRVSYYRYNSAANPGGNTLGRRADNWGGAAYPTSAVQPLAETVVSLAFLYYDANNNLLTPQQNMTVPSVLNCPPGNPAAGNAGNVTRLTLNQLDQVRRIAVTIQTQTQGSGIQPLSYAVASHVDLRNVPLPGQLP